jgi:2-C-methyl-D-erythritol 4-phosphate cytidylyltransferase
MKTVAIIPAAGLGTRMGRLASESSSRKQFLTLGDAPVFVHTIRQFVAASSISEVLIAVREGDREGVEAALANETFSKPVRLAPGGTTRQESVKNCLAMTADDVEIVAVHDAVRPFVSPQLIDQVVEQATRDGAVILGLPAVDTVKRVDQRVVHATLPRESIMLAQTPQVFRAEILRNAYDVADRDGFTGTDEASLVEHSGEDVHVMMGSARNIKITRPADLQLAQFYLDNPEAAE